MFSIILNMIEYIITSSPHLLTQHPPTLLQTTASIISKLLKKVLPQQPLPQKLQDMPSPLMFKPLDDITLHVMPKPQMTTFLVASQSQRSSLGSSPFGLPSKSRGFLWLQSVVQLNVLSPLLEQSRMFSFAKKAEIVILHSVLLWCR